MARTKYENGEEVIVIATGVRGEVVKKTRHDLYEVKHPGIVDHRFYMDREIVSVKSGR